eukprot:359517-Chlamydomonas_euryale.AAC.31
MASARRCHHDTVTRRVCPSQAHSATAARISGQGVNLAWAGTLRNPESDATTGAFLTAPPHCRAARLRNI